MKKVTGCAVVITDMDLSIFDAFPEAIVSGVWQIGICQHGTVIGNQFTKVADICVIIDEENNSLVDTTPEALRSDLLLYVIPCQMPTIDTNKLVSSYMLYNALGGEYYMIVDAGVGKNQHTGAIEHVELRVVQTEVADV